MGNTKQPKDRLLVKALQCGLIINVLSVLYKPHPNGFLLIAELAVVPRMASLTQFFNIPC